MNEPVDPANGLDNNVRKVFNRIRGHNGKSRVAEIAAICGLPDIEDIPRPGKAKNWRFDEWLAWGKKYNFAEMDPSTHSHVISHPYFRKILVTPAKTTGDVRSGMALACETRRNFWAEYSLLSTLAEQVTLKYASVLSLQPSVEPALVTMLEKIRHTPEGTDLIAAGRRAETERVKRNSSNMSNNAKTRRIQRLLRTVAANYKESPRAALAKILHSALEVDSSDEIQQGGTSSEAFAERIYVLITDGLGVPSPIDDILIDEMNLAIEMEEVEREEQRAKRIAAREAVSPTKQEDALPEEVMSAAGYGHALAAVRKSFKDLTVPALELAKELALRIQELDHLGASFHSPSWPTERMKAMEAEIAALQEQLKSNESDQEEERLVLEARARSAEDALEKVQRDRDAADALLRDAESSAVWRTEYAKLVNDIGEAFVNDSFLASARGIETTKALLDEARKKLGK